MRRRGATANIHCCDAKKYMQRNQRPCVSCCKRLNHKSSIAERAATKQEKRTDGPDKENRPSVPMGMVQLE